MIADCLDRPLILVRLRLVALRCAELLAQSVVAAELAVNRQVVHGDTLLLIRLSLPSSCAAPYLARASSSIDRAPKAAPDRDTGCLRITVILCASYAVPVAIERAALTPRPDVLP